MNEESPKQTEHGNFFLSYESWTEMLAQHFFQPEFNGRPVMFSVDEKVLASVSGLSEDEAVESLTKAVRARMGSPTRLFEEIYNENVIWKNRHADSIPPPSIPLLAVSVLAATRMESRGTIRPNNYYVPFRELLGIEVSVNSPYEYVEMMWQHLTWWLNEHKRGELGISTARPHHRLTNIGWALSQAFFRQSDLQRLTHFFQWLGLEPGEEIQPSELMVRFKTWAARAGRLSAGAQMLAGELEFEEQLKVILLAQWASWDGGLRDEQGRRMGRILLKLQLFPRRELSFVAERPDGFPERGVFRDADGNQFTLISSDEGWYDECPIGVTSVALSKGVRLRSEATSLSYGADKIVPLRESEALGGWGSVRRTSLLDLHWILAHESYREQIRHYLESHADPGWSEVEGTAPPGWLLFRDVIFSSAVPSDELLERLAPSVRERPVFWGGLPVGKGHTTFLKGGEPDLWVPAAPPGVDSTDVFIDGKLRRISSTGGVIPLTELGLDQGRHEVVVQGARLSFETIETFGTHSTTGTGSIGHLLRREGNDYYPASSGFMGSTDSSLTEGMIIVSGARIEGDPQALPRSSRPPLLVPLGATKAVLIGSQVGQVQTAEAPMPARWLREVGLHPFGFEVYPSFEVVWIGYFKGSRWHTRSAARRQPMESSGASDEAIGAWRDYIMKLPRPSDGEDASLWVQYLELAGSPNG